MTSTSVGWVLLDRQGPDAFTLDHDAFDLYSTADDTTHDTSRHTAAARGAQAIATASGHNVSSVRVTWSEDVEADAAALLKSLADLGFDNVLSIPLNQATQTWGIEVARANEQIKTALCILEPGRATVMVVATGAGSVRTAVTTTRDDVADLSDWLTTIFRRDGWLPESLYLVGARDDLDEVAGPIGDALPIPVSDSVDTQLALALGAALVRVMPVAVRPSLTAETPAGDPTEPAPRRDRPRFASHARKLTLSAAAVSIVGAALSLAAGSALNVENVSAQEADPQAESASVTSASVHTVPTRISAPPALPVQPLVARPLPAPAAPPETPQLPAEPLAAAVPEPAPVPVHHAVSAPPPAAPLAAPAAPVAPLPAAPLAAPAAPAAPFIAPPAPAVPPAAPLAVPVAPITGPPPGPFAVPQAPVTGPPPGPFAVPPAASLAVPVAPIAGPPPGPLAVPQAPVAVPPAAPLAVPPAPVAPPPAPDPAELPPAPDSAEPPPPDPLQAALSPLVGGLP